MKVLTGLGPNFAYR